MTTIASLSAAEIPFYVGTYTKKGDSKGIYRGTLDTDTGKLGVIEVAAAAGDPNFLTIVPGGKFLYAATSDEKGSVAAFAVGSDGKLTALNSLPSGDVTCHVSTDGRNVLAANYTGGTVVCFSIKPDGSLDRQTALVTLTGSGPDPKRQTKPHAHSVFIDGNVVYACDLGTDNVWSYRYDAAQGALTPTEPASGKAPGGSGPRHLALSADEKFAYTCNEMGLSVTAFARDPQSGVLAALQSLPTLPEGASTEGATTAEIRLHPSGKWLYISNRGHDSITVFAVGADGRLTWVENTPAQVEVPRGFTIDPTGKWLVAAGQKDNKIAVLKIDLETGKLSSTDQSASVPMPVCIVFAPR